MSRSRWPRASSSASSARTAPARRRCSTCCRASTGRRPGRSRSTGGDITRRAAVPAARRGPRPDVPDLERLPAADRARERAARRGGAARRTLRIWRRAARRPQGGRAGALGARPGRPRRARAVAPAGALAHGDKRKLELAMVLAGDPRVIMLDEPMAGMSVEDVPELVELISRCTREERQDGAHGRAPHRGRHRRRRADRGHAPRPRCSPSTRPTRDHGERRPCRRPTSGSRCERCLRRCSRSTCTSTSGSRTSSRASRSASRRAA